MIPISTDFDLGRDRTRIKDPRDAERQQRTVEVLLERMFSADPAHRWELQLVADEVGMGKTFVALALAYSILAALRRGDGTPDLARCTRRVLVISPQNSALTKKWGREVQEFVRRCIGEELAEEAREWFAPEPVDRLDDLARKLRDPKGRGVLVTHMGVLAGGKKFQHYNVKRRFLLGVLFRYWGVRFQRDARERLLKGAPDGWPSAPDDLTDLNDWERSVLPFDGEAEVLEAVRVLGSTEAGAADLDALLVRCKEIAAPYVRNRNDEFGDVEKGLNRLYRRVCFAGVKAALPLVIVDEAHNWKNGPRQKTNGYAGFEELIAPIARRVLLLTATPFQLGPAEMLELLRVGSIITPSPSEATTLARRAHLDAHREQVIRPVLENAARQSRVFAKAWARLPLRTTRVLAEIWSSPALVHVRRELRELAHEEGVVDRVAIEHLIEGAAVGHDPDVREILREGLRLYTYNEDLSQELGALVIRHRRRTDHRLVRVGSEYEGEGAAKAKGRSDRHVLHAAAGIDVRGDGELPHYLLMRVVSDMKKGKGRTSLGSALTGCYSTLLASAEGKGLRTKAAGDANAYLDLLLGMVGEAQDPAHPKVRAVVESVLETWRRGEKSLLFCFRTHTANRLQAILDDTLRRELESRRDAVLGGPTALTRLRSRFTRREGDLVVLGLDRVLWSLRWAAWSTETVLPDLGREDLTLTDDELGDLARLALAYDVDLEADQVDRVFIHRATEHLLARRLRAAKVGGGPLFRKVLDAMVDEDWVRSAYGLDHEGDAERGEDAVGEGALDERGVHVRYTRVGEPSSEARARLARDLVERRARALRQGQVSIFDSYASAPSFWLGPDPEGAVDAGQTGRFAATLSGFHRHLLALGRHKAELDWRERLLVMQALRRALMRESVLVRILPERSRLEDHGWAELLTERFFVPLPGQHESMADRLTVFLEDLQAADGRVHDGDSPRGAMYEATRMRETGFVVLVDGGTDAARRERVFAGFNSPLLPEVLVCTTVGQEGIDLHRHCRNVVHYDLAWNPAVLEQRTGRVDRIGSKTFRERHREVAVTADPGFLDVGVPFLAGTYDERMYEELRIRAQTFEVLTGGDVAADDLEGRDDGENVEGAEEGLAFPALPPEMVSDLRVRLHVWEDAVAASSESLAPHKAASPSALTSMPLFQAIAES